MNKIKYCKFCDKEKPEEDFCKSGGFIKNICRDCQNKKQKQIYQDSKRTKQLEQEIERLNKKYDNLYNTYLSLIEILGHQLSFEIPKPKVSKEDFDKLCKYIEGDKNE